MANNLMRTKMKKNARRTRKFKRFITRLEQVEYVEVTNPDTGKLFWVTTLILDRDEILFIRQTMKKVLAQTEAAKRKADI